MKQILCFGDSNTYGLVPRQNARYGWGVRWTSRLSEKLEKKSYHVIEEGLCGRTSVFDDPLRLGRRGTELLPVLLETHAPVDVVVLMLGTNDCKTVYGASPEVIGKGMERLVAQIKQSNPEIKILLISPIHLGEKVWQKEYDPEFSQNSVEVSKQLGDVYERIAREQKISFMRASDYAEASEADQEHLNEEGHGKLAKAIYENLVPVFS